MSSIIISSPTVNIWYTYVQEKAGPEASGRREAGWGGGRQGTIITLILQVLIVRLSGTQVFFASVSGSRSRFVADPDPYVFGPPGSGSGSISQRYGSGSGSGSIYHRAKIVRKPLIPTVLWLFLTFYLWKMMLKYLQNVISRKTFCLNKFFVGILKANDENNRIQIHLSEAWICGSGSTPKFHGSATLSGFMPKWDKLRKNLIFLYQISIEGLSCPTKGPPAFQSCSEKIQLFFIFCCSCCIYILYDIRRKDLRV